jgi:hypothetical protein
MKPKQTPYRPHFWDLAEKRKRKGYHFAHSSWAIYLP